MKKQYFLFLLSFIFINNNCFVQEQKQIFLYTQEGIFSRPFLFSFGNGIGYLEIYAGSLAGYWIEPNYNNDSDNDGLIYQVFQEKYTEKKQSPFTIINMKDKEMLFLPSKDGRVAYVIPLKDAGDGKWPVFCGVEKELFDIGYFILSSKVEKISSYFTEKIGDNTFTYNPSGFSNGVIRHGVVWTGEYERNGTIWVTGGSGIGESTTVKSYMGNSGIILQNGFIAPWNLDLYYQNSRIKRIRIEYKGFSEIVDIADTPNPQIIDLKRDDVEEVTITIVEVYPGTKYNNTAISSILFLKKREMSVMSPN